MSDILKIPKLKGSLNYKIWSIRVEALLIKEGYLLVISKDLN